MAHEILKQVLADIQTSPFIAIMVDETTNISNVEQLTLVIRWVDRNLCVHEEFLGLYSLNSTDAESIVDVISDVLLRFRIPFSKVRGQCYDGCSTMAGAKAGVAARIAQKEPRAVYTHCFGHALNLAVSDTVRRCQLIQGCLDTSFEVVKLIKFSPKREAMLRSIKEQVSSDCPGVRTLCPTRWTVRADSLASILANYGSIQHLWESSAAVANNTEMRSRILCVKSQMTTFKYFFGLVLSEVVLRHTDKLSQTLQKEELSSVEGHSIAMLTVQTLQRMRSDEDFKLFWKAVNKKRGSLSVDDPVLPRRRKRPCRFEEGLADPEHPETVEDYYHQGYFEALDLAISCIKDRFNQKGYATFSELEQLLLNACCGLPFSNALEKVCTFFSGDFKKPDLDAQLQVLHELFCNKISSTEKPSVHSLTQALKSLTCEQRELISEVVKLYKLLLVLPATNATSERTFSALRRIKTYLRSTMRQPRLNHLMVLHYHQDRTDDLDLGEVYSEYVSRNEVRKSTFATL